MNPIKSYLIVLTNKNFAKLWVSQAASQLTNYILSFAILIKVFDLTHSTLSVAIIIAAFGAASLFFGSVAGVFADRFDRKWILTITNFLQAVSVGLFFVVGGNFLGLAIITFLYASLNQFYLPAEAPSIPNLVPKEQLLIANSYFAFTNSAALIIGFASAGPMILAFGQKGPFIATSALLIIATIATLLLPSLKPKSTGETVKRIWLDYKEGIAHFWNNKLLHFPFFSLISVNIINGMFITIAPAFIRNVLNINLSQGTLVVVAPLGVGILLGALTLGLESKYFDRKHLILAGFFGMGLLIFGLSFTNLFIHKYLYYSLLGLGIGYFNAHIFAPSHALLQTNADPSLRGRVYGTLYVVLQVAATLPTLIVGLIADRIALTVVVGALGVLMLFLGFLLQPKKAII